MKFVFLPIGSYEPHPNLPWDLDSKIAKVFAELLASKVEGVTLPTLPFSVSFEWEGAISLRVETLAMVLKDIKDSIKGTLVVVNAHGGNSGLLQALAREHGFYVIDIYKACGIKVGHAGKVECFVAKALGVIDRACERGAPWPEGRVSLPRLPVGSYDEEDPTFYDVQRRLSMCINQIALELKRLRRLPQ